MSANTGSALPIKLSDLRPLGKRASDLLSGVSYVPRKTVATLRAELAPKKKSGSWSESQVSAPQAESISVLKVAKELNQGSELLEESTNVTLNTVRMGLQIGMHLAALYSRTSGFESFRERRERNAPMTDSEKLESNALQETHAAITVFAAAYYVAWRLSSFKTEELSGVSVDFAGLPEPVALGGQARALNALIFHWGSYLKEVHTDLEFAKITQLYFTAVLEELKSRAAALKATEDFVGNTYQLEGSSFAVHGFQGEIFGAGPAIEFAPVRLPEIVGNQEAKRLAIRLAQFVMAYDPVRKMNPMVEFGAFPWLWIFQGNAGTGKTMLLRLVQTYVKDYCDATGRRFRLHPIPNGIISSLQGESAVLYDRWWSVMHNPNEIIVAPVDDAEAVYLDRRSHSSSEGSKLIVMSHLRLTEGSTALIRGNVLQPHATNNADMIDPPVFSRYMARAVVPGAETRNDYCDQLKILGDSLNTKAGSSLLRLKFPDDYVFLSDQGLLTREERDRKAGAFVGFKDKGLVELWETVERKKLSQESYDLYGTFFAALHKRFPQFTSRDVRNVMTCATSRLFGFDFPQEWLGKGDTFVAQDYDTKKTMILEMALAYQKGLTVEQVLFEEMTNYVETTIAMLDSGRKYRVSQLADEIAERAEAMELSRKRERERSVA